MSRSKPPSHNQPTPNQATTANEMALKDVPIAMDARDFRTALGCFATGVTIITAMAGERMAGLTCNSFASVSLNPAMVLWSLSAHSPSLGLFQEASHFTVNVLGQSQSELAMQFARSSADKFAGVPWHPGLGGAPVIKGCIAQFQCRNASRHYGGDHVIFLGSVEAYSHTSDEPLLFARGKFGGFESAHS
jgi:flavin reductase (DIM6/NTAB) family NADH-FMN oxidoreductase RutF